MKRVISFFLAFFIVLSVGLDSFAADVPVVEEELPLMLYNGRILEGDEIQSILDENGNVILGIELPQPYGAAAVGGSLIYPIMASALAAVGVTFKPSSSGATPEMNGSLFNLIQSFIVRFPALYQLLKAKGEGLPQIGAGQTHISVAFTAGEIDMISSAAREYFDYTKPTQEIDTSNYFASGLSAHAVPIPVFNPSTLTRNTAIKYVVVATGVNPASNPWSGGYTLRTAYKNELEYTISLFHNYNEPSSFKLSADSASVFSIPYGSDFDFRIVKTPTYITGSNGTAEIQSYRIQVLNYDRVLDFKYQNINYGVNNYDIYVANTYDVSIDTYDILPVTANITQTIPIDKIKDGFTAVPDASISVPIDLGNVWDLDYTDVISKEVLDAGGITVPTDPPIDPPIEGGGELPDKSWWQKVLDFIGSLVLGQGTLAGDLSKILELLKTISEADTTTADPPPTDSDYNDTTNKLRLPERISQKFPFCIPFDLIRAIAMMVAPSKVPKFTVPFNMPKFGVEYSFNIDFTDYQRFADITRWFLSTMWLVGLIKMTKPLIK